LPSGCVHRRPKVGFRRYVSWLPTLRELANQFERIRLRESFQVVYPPGPGCGQVLPIFVGRIPTAVLKLLLKKLQGLTPSKGVGRYFWTRFSKKSPKHVHFVICCFGGITDAISKILVGPLKQGDRRDRSLLRLAVVEFPGRSLFPRLELALHRLLADPHLSPPYRLPATGQLVRHRTSSLSRI